MSDEQHERDLDESLESTDAPELNNIAETNEKLAEAHSGTETEAQAETPALPRVLRWILLVDARASVIASAVAVVAVSSLVSHTRRTILWQLARENPSVSSALECLRRPQAEPPSRTA